MMKSGRSAGPIGFGKNLEQGHRARGLARENSGQDAQAHQKADPDVVEEWKWMRTRSTGLLPEVRHIPFSAD
jgi:hypothetical protein